MRLLERGIRSSANGAQRQQQRCEISKTAQQIRRAHPTIAGLGSRSSQERNVRCICGAAGAIAVAVKRAVRLRLPSFGRSVVRSRPYVFSTAIAEQSLENQLLRFLAA